jgi:hypothetical protein
MVLGKRVATRQAAKGIAVRNNEDATAEAQLRGYVVVPVEQ